MLLTKVKSSHSHRKNQPPFQKITTVRTDFQTVFISAKTPVTLRRIFVLPQKADFSVTNSDGPVSWTQCTANTCLARPIQIVCVSALAAPYRLGQLDGL